MPNQNRLSSATTTMPGYVISRLRNVLIGRNCRSLICRVSRSSPACPASSRFMPGRMA